MVRADEPSCISDWRLNLCAAGFLGLGAVYCLSSQQYSRSSGGVIYNIEGPRTALGSDVPFQVLQRGYLGSKCVLNVSKMRPIGLSLLIFLPLLFFTVFFTQNPWHPGLGTASKLPAPLSLPYCCHSKQAYRERGRYGNRPHQHLYILLYFTVFVNESGHRCLLSHPCAPLLFLGLVLLFWGVSQVLSFPSAELMFCVWK